MVVSGLDAVAQPDVEEQPDSGDRWTIVSWRVYASDGGRTDRFVTSCRRVSLLDQCEI